MIDIIITACIILLFIGEPIYDKGYIMKFRIVQKHNGVNYYYIIQQRWLLFWKKPWDHCLTSNFHSCKCCEKAIDDFELKLKTNHVILEKTIED
jgi:hypothetical protein